MRTLTRITFALVALAVMSPLRVDAVDEATKRAMDDYVIVSFGFDVSADGRISNIRVAGYMNPSDGRELKNMLTPKEQDRGARFIASKKMKTTATEHGKTRYVALIFDKRTREYTDK